MFFSRLDSVGQLLSAHETHVTSTHYSHNSAPPTSRSDGFLWTTTSSCCCEARSSSSNSSSTYVLLQHPVLLQYTLLQHPLSSKDNTSTSSDILAAASQAKAAAVLIPGSTSTHMKVDVAANFGLKMSPVYTYFTKLHSAVPSAGRTRARTSRCLRRRDGKECRLYTHNGTKALIRHLHQASYNFTNPRRFAINASYECSCFWRITTQPHPKKS